MGATLPPVGPLGLVVVVLDRVVKGEGGIWLVVVPSGTDPPLVVVAVLLVVPRGALVVVVVAGEVVVVIPERRTHFYVPVFSDGTSQE